MKRRLYYTVLILITASCMLFGTFRHILAKNRETQEESFANVALQNGSGEFNQQLEAFDSIDARLSVCSITIQRGDSYSISGYYVKDMKSDFEIKGRVLCVTQNEMTESHVLGVHRDDNGIVITLPEEANLSRISLSSSVATISIREVDADRCRVYNETGDLIVQDMRTEYGMFSVNAGNIEMSGMDFNRLHIRSGVSEVHVATPADLGEYHVRLSTGVGNISYDGDQFRGSLEKRKTEKKLLEIVNGTGDILVSHKAK